MAMSYDYAPNGEISPDDCDEIVDLEAIDIDECGDVEMLHRWYFNATELADDVIAQIEANKISEVRDLDWTRRATGILIGLKKKCKRIERHCSENGLPTPDRKDLRQAAEITHLKQQVIDARAFERSAIIEWLRSLPNTDAIIAGLEGKAHMAHRRAAITKATGGEA